MKQKIKLIMSDGKFEIYLDVKKFNYYENSGNLFFERNDGLLEFFPKEEFNSFILESYTDESNR